MKKILIILLLAINSSLVHGQTNTNEKLKLHVPSPKWEDQVVYFLLLDLFADGDVSNNDQGGTEYDQKDSRKFSSGDIQGVIGQLHYIQNIDATAIWITPPVTNQWWDMAIQFSGYHGYWAENFKEVDKHFGTLELYQQLSHEIHKRGMYVIQDIVLIYTGNFFHYEGGYDKDNVDTFYLSNKNSTPALKPTQYPFNLNDPWDPQQKNANIYHWALDITDYENPIQKLAFLLGKE